MKDRKGKIANDAHSRPLFKPDRVGVLTRRVEACARSAKQRSRFVAILRAAFQDVAELEPLHADLPGVFRCDPRAVQHFRDLLGLAARRTRRPQPPRSGNKSGAPPEPRRAPCSLPETGSLIDATDWLGLAIGARKVSGGVDSDLDVYLGALRDLWRRSRYLETLNRHARLGVGPDGRDRMGEVLRLLDRGTGDYPVPGAPFVREPGFGPESWDGGLGPCFDAILDGVRAYRPTTTTHAIGIASVRPDSACFGDTITIRAIPGPPPRPGFGAVQPIRTRVVFPAVPFATGSLPGGMVVAAVQSWANKRIVVTVPAGAVSGCIGFLVTDPGGRDPGPSNRRIMDDVLTGLVCLGGPLQGLPTSFGELDNPGPPPCLYGRSPRNYVRIAVPVIESFLINGEPIALVEPDEDLVLSWVVQSEDSVQVRRRPGRPGPGNTNFLTQTEVMLNLGPSLEVSQTPAMYDLRAINTCGTTRVAAIANLRKIPELAIAGVEVVQAIQRMTLGDAANPLNNTVPLAAGRRTLVRVYVELGIGEERWLNGRQPNVTGEVIIRPAGRRAIGPIGLDDGGHAARPFADLDRNLLDRSLNFEIPLDLATNTIELDVRAWVDGHEDDAPDSGWVAQTSVGPFSFTRCESQVLVPILVTDGMRGLPAPTEAEFLFTLEGMRARYPFPEDGIVIREPFLQFTTEQDLTTQDGWEDLLNEIDDFVTDSAYAGDAFVAAMVLDFNAYALQGIETQWRRRISFFPPRFEWWRGYPRFVTRAQKPATMTHEIGHLYGLGHTSAADLGIIDNQDERLPNTTQEIGFDFSRMSVVRAGRGEIMNFGTDNRWTSIAHWNIVFDLLSGGA